jgi:hypothetical protein
VVRASINRSQSLLATSHRLPLLAPSRGDRARLEALLSDVWSREVLPFPGMTVRARSEHLMRSSATSVIRKLSVASIASSFTKRSGSITSLTKASPCEEPTWLSYGGKAINHITGDKAAFDKTLEPVGSNKARLPAIVDELDRGRQTQEACLNGNPARPAAIEIRLETMKKDISCEDSAQNGSPSVSRATSFDSLRQQDTQRSTENSWQLRAGSLHKKPAKQPPEAYKQSPIKPMSRWPRVGFLHRDMVVQGIRSFFR